MRIVSVLYALSAATLTLALAGCASDTEDPPTPTSNEPAPTSNEPAPASSQQAPAPQHLPMPKEGLKIQLTMSQDDL